MKKIYMALFVLAVLFIAGCSKNNATGNSIKDTTNDITESTSPEPKIDAKTSTIEISASGFSPKELTIKKGDTVTWINKDTKGRWPASATHPTHDKYPGSGITKCGTTEEGSIFDACRNLNAEESWSFTFNEIGTWAYHDHSLPKDFGKVIVE